MIVDAIGRVTVLTPPAVELTLRVVGSADSVDVSCSLRNTGNEDVLLETTGVSLIVHGYFPSSRHEPDLFFKSGYTERQLSFGAVPVLHLTGSFFPAREPGAPLYSPTYERVLLRPGERGSVRFRNVQLPPGEYELFVRTSYRKNDEYIPVESTTLLDIPSAEERAPDVSAPSRLSARAQGRWNGEWLEMDVTLSSPTSESTGVFAKRDEEYVLPAARVVLHSESAEIPAEVRVEEPPDPWKLVPVGESGAHFRFRVRASDRSSSETVVRMELLVLTETGVERVPIETSLPPVPAEPSRVKPERLPSLHLERVSRRAIGGVVVISAYE